MPALIPFIGQQLVKIGNRFLGKPLTSGTRVFGLTSPEVYADIDLSNAIEKGFDANVAVYSIVTRDAKKFGSIPRYLYEVDRKEEKANKPVVNNDLYTLLNRPNKNQSQDAFLTLVRAYYKICGESFIWLNRGDIEEYRFEDGSFDDAAIDKLPVLEMQVLPPNYITLIPDPMDLWGVLGYVLEIGERVTIRTNDVIHWKMPNLDFDAGSRTHLRGMSPLRPGAKTLEENNSMAKASLRQAQNDGAKAVIYEKTLKAMTPEQQSQLKRVIDQKINNTDVAGAVATLQGDWGMLDLSMSSHDMELLKAKEMTYKELCFLFGFPYEFFDAQTTYANKEMALVGWITNEISPDCKQLDGEFNRVLPKAFGLEGRVFIASDATDLPEVQKSIAESAKAMQEIWCITPDEVREYLGQEPLGGDFAEPWVPTGRTPMSKANQDDGADDILNEITNGRRGVGDE